MEEPKVPKKGPYAVEVEKEEEYYWCSCGRSAQQTYKNASPV